MEIQLDTRERPALDQKVADYIRKYHPAAYGTHIKRRWEDEDGWHAIVWRGKSAD